MEYALLIVVIVGVVFFRTPVGKGSLESFNNCFGRNKPNQQYVIHNLMMSTKANPVKLIISDHLRIFVIETKNYAVNLWRENQKNGHRSFNTESKNHSTMPILQAVLISML